jgi:hypothetical protein
MSAWESRERKAKGWKRARWTTLHGSAEWREFFVEFNAGAEQQDVTLERCKAKSFGHPFQRRGTASERVSLTLTAWLALAGWHRSRCGFASTAPQFALQLYERLRQGGLVRSGPVAF